MRPIPVRCGDCGARLAASLSEYGKAGQPSCERCQQAAKEGRPYFPGSAMSKQQRAEWREIQALLSSGDIPPLRPEDAGIW
jgi:hypothetical protein